MNRKEKIEAIYEKIADKIPTLGCKTEVYSRDDIIISYYNKKLTFLNDENGIEVVENYDPLLIGHPVMIGDVIDYIHENNIKLNNYDTFNYFGISKSAMYIFEQLWQKLKAPIEDQSDDCIDFVYDLIF